ncbi:MAG: CPBP family intramembrane metalloprotease [Saprospiraceae bacterium]|nr:CPBP family intramembrane metalloprotease [Saprospiraceae bacterium]
MNFQSKDALNNLLLLILYVFLGLFFFFLTIMLALLFSGDVESIKAGNFNLSEKFSGNTLLTIQLLSHIFGLILPAFLISRSRNSVKNFLGTLHFSGSSFMFSVALLLLSLPLINLLTYINLQIPLPDFLSGKEKQMEEIIKQFLQMNSFLDLLIRIIIIAIIPAIGEEWIFRGVIQNQLIRVFNNKWMGLIVASIVFSGIHMQFQGFLPRMALGLILGYTYIKSNSLVQPIFLHFLFNGMQVIMVYVLGVDAIDNQLQGKMEWQSISILSILSIPLLYLLLTKYNKQTAKVT